MDLNSEYGKELYKLFDEKDTIISLETFGLRVEVLNALRKTIQLETDVSLPTQFVEMDYCCDCCKVEFKLKLDANNGDINIDPPYFCKNCKDMV